MIEWIDREPNKYKTKTKNGLQMMWITPLRALAKDIARAMQEALDELEIGWQVGIRSGDTPTAVRQQQKKLMPEILLITPKACIFCWRKKSMERCCSIFGQW
ncbi:hypothetical protein MKQ70_21120 [Chitinophaga sedimenti]|nr:DEAD/DEAH box helicase [Chitinophaga sedimenti]MCK7557367.1 hypothetical protein [Chitinophaga sedimenti]